MKGRKPARRGSKYEKKFVELVNKNREFNKNLRRYFGNTSKPIKAIMVMDNKLKSDVMLLVNDSLYGCSIKVSEADFSQLDRRWLDDLAEKLNMPVDIIDMLQKCITNKMNNKNDKFILDKYKDQIIYYFKNNIRHLLKELFVRKEDFLKYLIVCFYIDNNWYITKIIDVFEYIENGEIYTTSKGVLRFGDCLSMQRKGGNGRHVKVPKNHPSHPGNQIQFKLKPISLINNMPSNKIFKIYPND